MSNTELISIQIKSGFQWFLHKNSRIINLNTGSQKNKQGTTRKGRVENLSLLSIYRSISITSLAICTSIYLSIPSLLPLSTINQLLIEFIKQRKGLKSSKVYLALISGLQFIKPFDLSEWDERTEKL